MFTQSGRLARHIIAAGAALLMVWGLPGAPGSANAPLPEPKPAQSERAEHGSRAGALPVPPVKPMMMHAPRVKPVWFGKQVTDGNGAAQTRQVPYPPLRPFVTGRDPMSPRDVGLYRKIFALQEKGRWKAADAGMARLRDLRLRGHVLYQRYMHPTAYRSGFEELRSWLALYSDHPGAGRIHSLAVGRMPDDFTGHMDLPVKGRAPQGALEHHSLQGREYVSGRARSPGDKKDIASLERAVARDLARGAPSGALARLEKDGADILDAVEYDRLRADIAAGFMYAGNFDQAFLLARASMGRSGVKAPIAGWVSGLIAWHAGKYEEAARYFEQTAQSEYADGWTVSAGAYWASRAHMRARSFRAVSKWLRRAAQYPRTFYGLIALEALGQNYDFNWEMPALKDSHIARIRRLDAGMRALLLIQTGQFHLAEAELRNIHPGDDRLMREALFALAHEHNLPGYALRLANAYRDRNERFYDAALYPLPPWEPSEGFSIDRALLFALIRQESRFDPLAESPSGATGLMQLMPATADSMDRQIDFRGALGQYYLKNPLTNIAVGQRYVVRLLSNRNVDGDLFALAIAYNAGPGNLSKWKSRFSYESDPLLFIEMIPAAETRAFVERVMRNLWIYRIRMGQELPSLKNVISGDKPLYVAQDSAERLYLANRKDRRPGPDH